MPMFKRSMVILVLITALAAGMTVYTLSQEETTALPLERAEALPEAAAAITVYVSGAVVRPGVVTLADGARIEQAVTACGGVLPTADMGAVNLAQLLKDGMQVRVPEKAGQGSASAVAAQTAGKDDRVNINTADEKALDTLPGIGPAMAKRIVEYRTTNGAFQSLEELKKVRGIGEAKYEKLKDRVAL